METKEFKAKTTIQNISNFLKGLAKQIVQTKILIKNIQRGETKGVHLYTQLIHLHSLKHEFRHYHIAISEIRGSTREQIEKPSYDNRPNDVLISQIKEELLKGLIH